MASCQCYSDELQPFVLVNLILPPVAQAVLYGVNATLFCRCMHIFRQRQLGQGHKVILTGTVFLFFFCSIQCILSPVLSFSMIIGAGIAYNTLYVITNLIADSLFTYRCYVIWGRKKSIIWVPLCMILTETVFGGFSAQGDVVLGENSLIPNMDQRAPLYITLVTNVMLTLLSAGRIWWVSRELKVLGPKVSRKYNAAIALIIESGAMYCVFIAAYVITIPTPSNVGVGYLTASRTLYGILNQIVGIVPTLMVVRIGLGVSTEDAQTVILASGIRFDRGLEGSGRIDTNDQMMVDSNSEAHTVIQNSVEQAGDRIGLR